MPMKPNDTKLPRAAPPIKITRLVLLLLLIPVPDQIKGTVDFFEVVKKRTVTLIFVEATNKTNKSIFITQRHSKKVANYS